MFKVIFIEIISILVLIYGYNSRKKYKEEWEKMPEEKKAYRLDTQVEINAIIITGILGIIGGLVFLISEIIKRIL